MNKLVATRHGTSLAGPSWMSRAKCSSLLYGPLAIGLAVFASSLSGCGGKVTRDAAETQVPPDSSTEPEPPLPPAPPPAPDESSPRCVALPLAAAQPDDDDQHVEFACGLRSAAQEIRSPFLVGGQSCESPQGANTFALRLTRRLAADYSTVVRCGYILYENGSFVGERFEVEARDGEWCDELALQRLELRDRMLLTDVSFAIEAKDGRLVPWQIVLQTLTSAGWTEPVPAEYSLCLYVAHQGAGASTCLQVKPADYCVCPCRKAWRDFLVGTKLWLAEL